MSIEPTREAAPTPVAEGFATDLRAHTVGSAVGEYWRRIRSGDLGALPAVLGIATLVVVFAALRPATFPSPQNFANLLVQALPITILAMGLVFVLLVGEIDLAAGVTGGMCSGVMATFIIEAGQPWFVGVAVALVVGLLVGLVIGLLVAVVGVPSFVVSLAFFLGLQGVTLLLIGQGGTVPIRDQAIIALANESMPIAAGWVLAGCCVAGYALVELARYRRQLARGLARTPLVLLIFRIAAIGTAVLGSTWALSLDRARSPLVVLAGIPYGVPLVAALLIVCTFVLTKTPYGRHIYAVGGNREAARRAGIAVTRVRVSVFMVAATLAALSGIVAASRIQSVTPDAGAGNTLLYAVGAAVIGGTSLFGGKGKASAAVLGGLVIAIIDNGLGLLRSGDEVKFIVTGLFLLLAASVDAVARRRRAVTGR